MRQRPLKFKCKYCGFIQPIDCDPYEEDIPAVTCQNCKTLIIPGKITIEPDPLGMESLNEIRVQMKTPKAQLTLLVISMLLITGCTAMPATTTSPQQVMAGTQQPTQPRTTATPDVSEMTRRLAAAETAQADAQAEADAANRLLVQATNDEQQRRHDATQAAAQVTAQAQADRMIINGWTATAAQTSIPLTSTAYWINATAITGYSTMQSAAMTATMHAPTQMIVMQRAQDNVRYAPVYFAIEVVGKGSLIFFVLAVGIFALLQAHWQRQPKPAEDKAEPSAQRVIPIENHFIVPTDTAPRSQPSRYVLPCTPEQLDELAEETINGKTLATNSWGRRTSRTWSETQFLKMRYFMQANEMVRSAAAGNLALTAAGEGFLRAWIETRALPSPYVFTLETASPAVENSHGHGGHEHGEAENAVGEAG